MKKLKRWGKKINIIEYLKDTDKTGKVVLLIIATITLVTIVWLILFLFDLVKLTIVWGVFAMITLIMNANILISYYNDVIFKSK
jgi:hypothetical protein